MKTFYLCSYDPENKIVVKRDDTHSFDNSHTSAEQLETFTNNQIKHKHDFYEISYVVSGSGIQVVNDVRYSVQKGDFMFSNITDNHAYYPLKNLIILSILIDPDVLQTNAIASEKILDSNGCFRLPPLIRFSSEDFLTVENIILTMEREYNTRNLYYQDNLLHQLSLLFIYSMRAENTVVPIKGILNPALEYIAEHINTVTLSDAAAYCCYNPSYFSKIFHEKMGITFIDYVNRQRINKAIQLILTTNYYSVESICYLVGYKEKKNFYALFKKYTGLTPSMFRKPAIVKEAKTTEKVGNH